MRILPGSSRHVITAMTRTCSAFDIMEVSAVHGASLHYSSRPITAPHVCRCCTVCVRADKVFLRTSSEPVVVVICIVVGGDLYRLAGHLSAAPWLKGGRGSWRGRSGATAGLESSASAAADADDTAAVVAVMNACTTPPVTQRLSDSCRWSGAYTRNNSNAILSFSCYHRHVGGIACYSRVTRVGSWSLSLGLGLGIRSWFKTIFRFGDILDASFFFFEFMLCQNCCLIRFSLHRPPWHPWAWLQQQWSAGETTLWSWKRPAAVRDGLLDMQQTHRLNLCFFALKVAQFGNFRHI